MPNVDVSTARIRVTLTDAAGNSATSQSGLFVIDSTAPVITSANLANGAAIVTQPSVLLDISGSDANGVYQMRYSEDPVFASTNWISYSTQSTIQLSAVNGDKTVYFWVKDQVGNISNAASDTVKMDFGSPPVVSIISPTNTTPATTSVDIHWACSSTSGLASNPINLYYQYNDGNSTSDIQLNLENNISSTEGNYTWTLPGGLGPFRVLVKCTSAGGVTSQLISDIVNTQTWRIFSGDIGVPREGLNAFGAVLTPVFTNRYSFAVDKYSNSYISDDGVIRKIDGSSGQIEKWVGSGSACTVDLDGMTLDLTKNTAGGWLQGATKDGQYLLFYVCNKLYKVNVTTKVATKISDIINMYYQSAILTYDGWLVYATTTGLIYRLNTEVSGAATPELIYGNLSTPYSCTGPLASGTATVNTPMARPISPCASSIEYAINANRDATKIYVGSWSSTNGHLGQAVQLINGVWQIVGGVLSGTDMQYCSSVNADPTQTYCGYRWLTTTIRKTNPADHSILSTMTIPQGQILIRRGGNGIDYALTTDGSLYIIGSSSLLKIAGVNINDVGINSNNPNAMLLPGISGIEYNAGNSKLYLTCQNDTKTILMNNTTTTDRHNISNENRDPTYSSLDGNTMLARHYNSGTGIRGSTNILTTAIQKDVVLQYTSTGFGPFTDGQSVVNTRVSLGPTQRILPHSSGDVYYPDTAGGRYIYKVQNAQYYKVAGTTGTAYRPSDHGQIATSAQLTDIKGLQEIPVGKPNAGDIIFLDDGRLRRISIASESSAPRIYDVADFKTAASGMTNYTSSWYDFSTESSDVLGSGKMYLANSSSVKRVKFAQDLASSSLYSYPFEGTTFSGNTAVALTPIGLMVLQTNKSRVLITAP